MGHKMRKAILYSLLIYILLECSSLYSLDLHMTQPEMVSTSQAKIDQTSFVDELSGVIDKLDTLNTIRLMYAGEDEPVLSLIDAGSHAMKNSTNYLLYGKIQETANWCEARFSLYELETDNIRTVFYSKVSLERHHELVSELGRKITDYIYREFGFQEKRSVTESNGYFQLSVNPGYWMVCTPIWSDVLLGYFNVGISGKIALPNPRLFFNGNEMYPRFGLSLDYSVGRNSSGLENYFYHSLQASFPLEIVLDFKKRHLLGISISPGYQFDLLNQNRKYSNLYNDVSGAFLIKAGVLYSFSPDKGNFSLGLLNQVDFSFYDELLISYKPSISLSYKIMNFKDSEDEN